MRTVTFKFGEFIPGNGDPCGLVPVDAESGEELGNVRRAELVQEMHAPALLVVTFLVPPEMHPMVKLARRCGRTPGEEAEDESDGTADT